MDCERIRRDNREACRAGFESATTRAPRPEEVGGAFSISRYVGIHLYSTYLTSNQPSFPHSLCASSFRLFAELFLLLLRVLFRTVPLLLLLLLPLGFNTRGAYT